MLHDRQLPKQRMLVGPHRFRCIREILEQEWAMGGNHHNYSYGDLQRNTSHMIRPDEIRVDPDAPDLAKLPPKQEGSWPYKRKQYP